MFFPDDRVVLPLAALLLELRGAVEPTRSSGRLVHGPSGRHGCIYGHLGRGSGLSLGPLGHFLGLGGSLGREVRHLHGLRLAVDLAYAN